MKANSVYVASYFAPNGAYSFDSQYFAAAGVDRVPLHALQNGVAGGNGVYAYGTGTLFPNSTYQATNYWVDVVFTPGDTTAPTVAAMTPTAAATGVSATTTVTATFSEAMDAATINSNTIELRDAGNALVASALSYNATTFMATLTPNAALTGSTTYTVTVKGGTTDPLVKDVAGNALAVNRVWSFTTAATLTGQLTGTALSPSAAADLTVEGPADWVHWGEGSVPGQVRKAAVVAQVSAYQVVAGGTVKIYGNDLRPLSWSDGAPTASGGGNRKGVYITGQGTGFSVTVPADTQQRTVKVYVGGWKSSGTFRAQLSDGSAADFVDTTPVAADQYNRTYALTYKAAAAGKQLKLTWTQASAAGNVTIAAVALVGP